MKAVILVAGQGTRLYPLTLTTPKCLLPVLNKPILLWQLEALEGLVDEVILVTRDPKVDPLQQQIWDYAKSMSLGITFSFAVQSKPLGTGDAFWQANEFVENEDRFLVLYGDDIYSADDLKSLTKQEFGMLAQKVQDPTKWGILQTNESGYLERIVEKPQEFVGDLASCGVYLFGKDIFNYHDQMPISVRGEFELTDLVSAFAQDNNVKVVDADTWIPIGYPWDLLTASESLIDQIDFLVEGEVEENVVVKGRLKLGKNSVIKSGTYIEGDMVIGENCTIGPNAHLRKLNSVGDASSIGFSVELKNCLVMKNTAIPHLINMGDSIVGNNVNVGGGSIIANWRHDQKNILSMVRNTLIDTGREKFGTVIGDEAKLGVKTIIYPGRKIWPNQKTLPGQVVDRDLEG